MRRFRVQKCRRDLPAGQGALLAGALFSAVVLLALPGLAAEVPEHLAGATYVGDETCAACHEDAVKTIVTGYHGDIQAFQAPMGVTGCESCHGPGSVHAESNDPADIIGPSTEDVLFSSKACLDCHRNDHLDGYEESWHALGDVSCASCHSIHGTQSKGLLVKTQTELCQGCHQEVESQFYLPSRHPVREGKMECSDCHDPHRNGYQTMLSGETANDLCFNCHLEKQGPFIFEHAPVVEDCATCHSPHGAVARPLLKQNEPFLCLQCHQSHFHSTLQGIEGDFTTLDGNSGTSQRDSAKQTMLTKCTQCHSEVHGSDLPSQGISGHGRALTR